MKHLYESLLDDEEDVLNNETLIDNERKNMFLKLKKCIGNHKIKDLFNQDIEIGDFIMTVDSMGWSCNIAGSVPDTNGKYQTKFPSGEGENYAHDSIVIKDSNDKDIKNIINIKNINKKIDKLQIIYDRKKKTRLIKNEDCIGRPLNIGDFVLYFDDSRLVHPGIICGFEEYGHPIVAENIESYELYLANDKRIYLIRKHGSNGSNLLSIQDDLAIINKFIK